MFKTLLIVFSLFALLVTPVMALAQDGGNDEMEMVDFESESGLLKLTYPADWFIADSGDESDPTSITFANSQDLLDRITSSESGNTPALEGDKGGVIIGFPNEVLSFLGIEMTDETTAQDAADAMGQLFFSSGEESVAELGDSELIEWEDQPEVGIVPFTEETSNLEGVVYTYFKDGYTIFGFIAAATGEFDEAYRDVALNMALTYEITIPADELFNQMMGQSN